MKEFKNELPELHRVCSTDHMRPPLMNVFIEQGLAVATDAHSLVWCKLKDFMDDKIVESLEGQYITPQVWKVLCDLSRNYWKRKPIMFELSIHKTEMGTTTIMIDYIDARTIVNYRLSDPLDIGKYPNWIQLWNQAVEKVRVDDVSRVNYHVFSKAMKVLTYSAGHGKSVQIELRRQPLGTQGTQVYLLGSHYGSKNAEVYGLAMPVMISENELINQPKITPREQTK